MIKLRTGSSWPLWPGVPGRVGGYSKIHAVSSCYICVCRLPVLWETGEACCCHWCVILISVLVCRGMCGCGVCDQSAAGSSVAADCLIDLSWKPHRAGRLAEPRKDVAQFFSLFECVAKIVHLPKIQSESSWSQWLSSLRIFLAPWSIAALHLVWLWMHNEFPHLFWTVSLPQSVTRSSGAAMIDRWQISACCRVAPD